MNRTMMAISVFALFALTIMGVSCASSTQASKTQTEPAPVADAAHTEHEDDGVPRISAAEAIEMVKSGKALIIDTRDPTSFEAMHVKGASNVPYKEFVDKTYKALPKDKELIFYCTWPSEHTSAGSAAILMKEGYKNVHALVGGLYAYKDAGGEVVQAATPTPAPDATKPATNLGGIAGAAPVKSNN